MQHRETPGPGGSDRESVEFGRVLAFSDGVFAIAATLLVVEVAVPAISDEGSVGDLASALNEMSPQFVSFLVGFAVIARYWYAHHQFFSLLARLDGRLIGVNLVYLCFIAFLPFPTAMLGDYFDNPLSVAIYALIVAVISGLEVLLLWIAHRHGLFRRTLTPAVFRWGTAASGLPVLAFLASVPIAFVSTWLAVVCWFAWAPLAPLLERRKPPEAETLLGS
jgi:uncharacterized membrane protein